MQPSSAALHPACETPWPSSCMLCLAWFLGGFLIYTDLRRVHSCQLLLFWKDDMPTLECWHVARDVSVFPDPLYQRAFGEAVTWLFWVVLKTSQQSPCSAPVTHSCATKACGYSSMPNKAMGLNTVCAHEKVIFSFPQYLCCVLVWTLMAYHLRHSWCCNYSVVVILPQKPIVKTTWSSRPPCL